MTTSESAGGRRRGPRAGGSDTRPAILAAAREEFAERGFAAATVRSIGARAGVDAAMINHYFGSKAGLFREVIQIPVDPAEGLRTALAGPREDLGRSLAEHVLGLWEDPAFRRPALAVLRSAGTEGGGPRLVREYLETQLIPLISAHARGADPVRATALAMTHVLGVAIGRHVVGLPALRTPTYQQLAVEIGPALQRYLDGPRPD